MKKILILLLLSSCYVSRVQVNFDKPFEKVFEDINGTKNDLYVKSNEWMVKNFNDATSIIEFSDKEEGVLIGKYLIFGNIVNGLYGTQLDRRVYCKIDIRVKENKARISIEPLKEWTYASGTIYSYSKQAAEKDINNLIESYHNSLLSKKIDF
jgi:hypothetical protein